MATRPRIRPRISGTNVTLVQLAGLTERFQTEDFAYSKFSGDRVNVWGLKLLNEAVLDEIRQKCRGDRNSLNKWNAFCFREKRYRALKIMAIVGKWMTSLNLNSSYFVCFVSLIWGSADSLQFIEWLRFINWKLRNNVKFPFSGCGKLELSNIPFLPKQTEFSSTISFVLWSFSFFSIKTRLKKYCEGVGIFLLYVCAYRIWKTKNFELSGLLCSTLWILPRNR